MKKEIESAKLSLRQHPFTGIRTVLCFVLLIGATPASFAHDDDYRHDYEHHHKHDYKFVLSLGDSLSVGVQPDAAGINQRTDDGYPDQLFNILSAEEDDLRLVKLGCENRETTGNMISGGECFYEEGSQLAQAVKFLRKHGDDVALITIDIGVNDVIFSGCLIETDGIVTGVDVGCILAPDGPFAQVAANLPIILSTLRQAADDDTPIVALNYYNTFLASWLTGLDGQVLAEQSAQLASILNNDVLGQTYAAFDVPVADVAGAFDSNNFTDMVPFPTPDGPFMIPQNVALICLWTYMCVPDPVGPNIHANPTGYGVIAATIEQVLPADDDDDYRKGHKHVDRHHDRHND
ncbi:MAG: SGNH/GDSL hydrolase family protein [Gammaproteobacteria bacterium]